MKLNENAMVTAKLLILCGARDGKTIPVTCSPFLIGRSIDCDLQPTCSLANQHHCALIKTEDGLMIRDLGSKDGTCVNNEMVFEGRLLKNRDQIYVGMEVYEVRFTASVSDARSFHIVPCERQERDYASVSSFDRLLYLDWRNLSASAN